MSASASVNGPAVISVDHTSMPRVIDSCQERLEKVADKVFAQIPPTGEPLEFNCPITRDVMKDPLNSIIIGLELLGPEPHLERAMELAAAEKDPEEKALIYKKIIAHFPHHLKAYELLVPLLKDPEEKRAIMLQAAENSYISTVITQEQWANAATLNLPPYPKELQEFLAGQCDIWPDRKRSETHIVVPLFPEVSIDGDQMSMTLESLDKLEGRSGGPGYAYLWGGINKTCPAEKEFHWAVMTNDVLPGSRNKSYDAQVRLLPPGYKIPGVFDAARAILWENRRTGTCYFSHDPSTYTRCSEVVSCERLTVRGCIFSSDHLMVGGFSVAGLDVSLDDPDSECVGIAGFRKF